MFTESNKHDRETDLRPRLSELNTSHCGPAEQAREGRVVGFSAEPCWEGVGRRWTEAGKGKKQKGSGKVREQVERRGRISGWWGELKGP